MKSDKKKILNRFRTIDHKITEALSLVGDVVHQTVPRLTYIIDPEIYRSINGFAPAWSIPFMMRVDARPRIRFVVVESATEAPTRILIEALPTYVKGYVAYVGVLVTDEEFAKIQKALQVRKYVKP